MHGKSGSFLACVASLSMLSILSRHEDHRSHSSLSLHYSRPAIRLVPAPPHQQLPNKAHGTKVVVRNLFGNMPVRVKQRVVEFADGAKQGEKEIESLKKHITALLIAWPRRVTCTLAVGESKKHRLNIHSMMSQTSQGPSPHNGEDLVPKAAWSMQLDLTWIVSVLRQANYVDPDDKNTWLKTSARTSAVTIKGVMSTTPAPTKYVQFISLGLRPIIGVTGVNALYDEINSLFAASSFGNAEVYDDLKETKHSKDRRFKHDGFTSKELRGGGKGIDRWPMFFIRIDLNNDNDLGKLERENVLASILKVIKAMVQGFLKDNHFRPRVRPQRNRNPTYNRSPALQRHNTVPDTFRTWSRIKSSRSYHSTAPALKAPNVSETVGDPTTRSSTPIPSEQGSAVPEDHPPAPAEDKDSIIRWTDPITKATILINARTGMACKQNVATQRPITAPASLSTMPRISDRRLSLRPMSRLSNTRAGSWASDFLSKWKNPVFATTESAIPQIPNETNTEPSNLSLQRHDHQCGTNTTFRVPSDTNSLRLSKEALAKCHVISQVDQKFILATLPTDHSHSLVLIDQHAADERVRVESLIEELHTQPSIALEKPLCFELPVREGNLLGDKMQYLHQFAIKYTIASSSILKGNMPSARCTVNVTALPPVIAERCRLQPSILLNLLRSIAWSETAIFSNPPPHSADPSAIATTARPMPPKELLDIINSRACRSAIMFNDALTHEESSELVRRLSKTKMPFQCAHGRNSMVPLLDLGKHAGSLALEGDEDGGESFSDAWDRWNRKGEADGDGDDE